MFEASDKCNLHNIKHIECDEFDDELQNSPDTLRKADAEAYFKILLGLFRKKDQPNSELTKTKMSSILSTLYEVLDKKQFRDIFVQDEYTPALPFSRKETFDDLLNILLLLSKQAPQVFDATVCSSFDNIVSRRGQNSFIILFNYCENKYYCIDNPADSDTKEKGAKEKDAKIKYANPWPMLDILFSDDCKGQERFLKPDLCKEYVRLLTRLCVNNKNVQEHYKQKPFEIIKKVLTRFVDDTEDEKIRKLKPDLESVKEAYTCLAEIAAIPGFSKKYKLGVPFDIILKHLKEPVLVRSALELLLETTDEFPVFVPSETEDAASNETKSDFLLFLKNLIRIAAMGSDEQKHYVVNNAKLASMILLCLAQRQDIAYLLIEQPVWMEKELPSFYITFQLFLIVYGHKELRSKLTSDPEFIIFLNILAGKANIQILDLCLRIFRHMNDKPQPESAEPKPQGPTSLTFSEEFLQDLNDSNFVTNFIETASDMIQEDEDNATYLIILLLDTVGHNYVTKEVMQNLKLLNIYIREDKNFDAALTAATYLAKHKEYAQKFKDMELYAYFKKMYQKQTGDFDKRRKRVRRFINTIKKALPKND